MVANAMPGLKQTLRSKRETNVLIMSQMDLECEDRSGTPGIRLFWGHRKDCVELAPRGGQKALAQHVASEW